jgi:hypothetical protein
MTHKHQSVTKKNIKTATATTLAAKKEHTMICISSGNRIKRAVLSTQHNHDTTLTHTRTLMVNIHEIQSK